MDRRTFLEYGALAAASSVAPLRAFVALGALAMEGEPGVARNNGGYGHLKPVRDKTTGESLLALPKGFQYRSFSPSGDVMSDGNVVPGRSDGMAAFDVGGSKVRIIRNHEIFFSPPGGAPGDQSKAYDPKSAGATTTLEVSAHAERVESWLSLNGTNANCAGGTTPWGTWITCEETPNGPDANISFLGLPLDLDEKHGYLFEVPVSRGPGELEVGEPIRAAGRFPHEAVAVDPATGVVYETDDDFASPSGFFRYTPPVHPMQAGRVLDGGVLDVLGLQGMPSVDLSVNQTQGVTYDVEWIRIEDPDPTFPEGIPNDAAAFWIMREEGIPNGAAIFSRLEGTWFGERKIFFNSTQGGGPLAHPPRGGFGEGFGQVWMYDIDAQTLTLIFESPGREVLELPDNLTVTPGGSLLLCEDGPVDNFLRGLTVDGRVFDFALNIIPGQEDQEFAGATFSPDGRTLFVNIQMANAITFAIWGPWNRGLL